MDAAAAIFEGAVSSAAAERRTMYNIIINVNIITCRAVREAGTVAVTEEVSDAGLVESHATSAESWVIFR